MPKVPLGLVARLMPLVAMAVMLMAPGALAQPGAIQLSISQPEDGDVVPRRLVVTGSSTGLAAHRILVFVYAPSANRWFFQGEADVAADGSWEVDPVVVSGGAITGAPGTGRPVDVQIVATAMADVPAGLSGIPDEDFPLSGTLAQSPAVSVRRED